MSHSITQCHAEETAACCCVDVGTVMDNSDCSAAYRQVFSQRSAAEAMLDTLMAKARAVESEPCTITSRLQDVPEGVALEVDFLFSCQAEAMIFQLGLR